MIYLKYADITAWLIYRSSSSSQGQLSYNMESKFQELVFSERLIKEMIYEGLH